MNKKTSVYLLSLMNHKSEINSDKHLLDTVKLIGADALDYSVMVNTVTDEGGLYSMGADAVREYFTELRKYADSIGVGINQTHGRLFGYAVSPEDTEVFIKNAELDCIATASLGAKYCVFHTPAYNKVGDLSDEEMRKIGFDSFNAILPFAKREGIKIAAETHGTSRRYKKMEFYGYVENLIELVDRIKAETEYSENICVCVDTGHTNLTVPLGNPGVGEVIRRLGSRVEVLHLHDNDMMTDQHKIPMTGTIDWHDVLAALEEIGYQGFYNLENEITHFGEGFEIEEAAFSVKVLKHLIK